MEPQHAQALCHSSGTLSTRGVRWQQPELSSWWCQNRGEEQEGGSGASPEDMGTQQEGT